MGFYKKFCVGKGLRVEMGGGDETRASKTNLRISERERSCRMHEIR